MGDSSMELTDENREAAQEAKSKAKEALSEGNYDEPIEHLTGAITLNPKSAIMYRNRDNVFIKLKKPNAAIRDENAALEINPMVCSWMRGSQRESKKETWVSVSKAYMVNMTNKNLVFLLDNFFQS